MLEMSISNFTLSKKKEKAEMGKYREMCRVSDSRECLSKPKPYS